MNQFIPLAVGIIALALGAVLGYYARQSIARKQAGTIEATLKKKIDQAKEDAEKIIAQAKGKYSQIIEGFKKEEDTRRTELIKSERLLLKKENHLDNRIQALETKENEFRQKVEKLKKIKENLENLHQEATAALERVANLSREDAKKELLEKMEKENEGEVLEKMYKLEADKDEKYEKRAKEILSLAIQKCGLSQAQELTTTTVSLPSDEIKGRIIGKEGRNIRTLERLTGVEIIVDETPEVVVISAFDPIRRQIAKIALEKLIRDGRIQPARIEDVVGVAETEIASQIKAAGEKTVYETGIMDLNPKIVHLLGRLKFRTSYGQNVLLHSVEVSHLSSAIAAEIGANIKIAKKAGLLHDIGKAVDHQVQGSHTDIGIKILEKFNVDKEIITAMKSHHEEYPYESLESVIVQTADQISGARPGARRDTLENYMKRLEELENIATSLRGVKKAYAIQAGREIRVFVSPEEISDLESKKMAKEIAKRIQEDLRYPGEIKVTVIRETRVIEYAK